MSRVTRRDAEDFIAMNRGETSRERRLARIDNMLRASIPFTMRLRLLAERETLLTPKKESN